MQVRHTIERFLKMDITQFESIYRSCFEGLYRMAYVRLREPDDARDVVQDAMLRLWQSGRLPDNVPAYLARAVLNGVIDRLRARGLDDRSRIVAAELIREEYDGDEEARLASLRAGVEQILDNEISPEAAAAFRAVHIRGLEYKEAAHLLGVTRSTINKHVVNVLRRLREKLKYEKYDVI